MAGKRKPRSRAIEKLDREWSIHIRYTSADSDGVSTCFTCGKRDHPRNLHCGHFASRRHLATRWNKDNSRVQCPGCNIFNQGCQFVFGRGLDAEEPGKAQRIYELSQRPASISTDDILRLAAELKEQNAGLVSAVDERAKRARHPES